MQPCTLALGFGGPLMSQWHVSTLLNVTGAGSGGGGGSHGSQPSRLALNLAGLPHTLQSHWRCLVSTWVRLAHHGWRAHLTTSFPPPELLSLPKRSQAMVWLLPRLQPLLGQCRMLPLPWAWLVPPAPPLGLTSRVTFSYRSAGPTCLP